MKTFIMAFFIMIMCSFSCGLDLYFQDMDGGSQELINFIKIDEGERIVFTVISEDVIDTASIKIWNKPNGSIFSNGIFEWTPGVDQDGLYDISFSAIDPPTNKIIYKTIRIIVSDTNFRVKYNTTFEHLFTATDPDNDNVEITISGLPDGAIFSGDIFDPKLLSWTPTEQQIGNYQMTLTATDSPNNGEAKQDIRIINIKVSRLDTEELKYDLNLDDKVNIEDFKIFSQNWMKGVPLPDPNNDNTSNIEPSDPEVVAPSYLDSIVYYTLTGTKYHKKDCSYLSSSTNLISSTIREAQDKDLTPCARCKPDDISYSSYSKLTSEQQEKIESIRIATEKEEAMKLISELMNQ